MTLLASRDENATEKVVQMKRIPKLCAWKRIIAELSAHHPATSPPSVPSSTVTRWEREIAWANTIEWAATNDVLGVISSLTNEDFVSEETFRPSEISKEDYAGEIGECLRAVLAEDGWTKHKRRLVAELTECLARHGYVEINGHGVRYVVSHVGGSFIYRVPAKQQGHLRPFRGETVRMVCTASGSRSYRTYMVGVVR